MVRNIHGEKGVWIRNQGEAGNEVVRRSTPIAGKLTLWDQGGENDPGVLLCGALRKN